MVFDSRMHTLGTTAMVTEGPVHEAGTFSLGVKLRHGEGGGHSAEQAWVGCRARVEQTWVVPPHLSSSQKARSISFMLWARSCTLLMLVRFFRSWASMKSPRLEPYSAGGQQRQPLGHRCAAGGLEWRGQGQEASQA